MEQDAQQLFYTRSNHHAPWKVLCKEGQLSWKWFEKNSQIFVPSTEKDNLLICADSCELSDVSVLLQSFSHM